MIIWLASYPKSGNTWVRSILAALLYSSDGAFNFDLIKRIPQFPKKEVFKDLVKDFSNFNEIKKNWITVQGKINSEKEIKLLKTHNGKYTVEKDNFTDDQNSLAVIYIVRDPRTLVKSISNHFTKSHYDASKFLIAPSLIGNGKSFEERKDGILTLIGKWNDHYRSWTKNKNNLLLIKYEDLVNNPETELTKLIKFLEKYINFKTSEKKNKTILETTSFSNLKNMEEQGLFKEGVLNKKTNNKANFFHLGPKNKWQENLDKKIINEIEKNFYNEMKELGYLK
tara:strand:+ start:222 stop:1067 length:846 start_codon:yes stop_codon:yes gene_type:complete